MTANAYTEDQFVEQAAIGLFAELGWQTVSAMEEVFGSTGTLGRETSGEVVLVPRSRVALAKLNPNLPPEAIASAVDELTRDLQIYGKASISQIHNRIGKEIPRRKLRRELAGLVASGELSKRGTTRAAVYVWTK